MKFTKEEKKRMKELVSSAYKPEDIEELIEDIIYRIFIKELKGDDLR